MSELHRSGLSSSSCPRTSRVPLAYLLLVGALVTALFGTTVESQARPQKAKAGAKKTVLRPMINLMALLDVTRDTVHGKWAQSGKTLRCNDQHFGPRVEIRYEPPEEYDFIIQFSQPKLRHAITAMMPNRHGGQFLWKLGVQDGNDYQILAKPGKDWYWKALGIIKANTIHTTIVQVRRNSIRCLLDGKELLRRKTDFKDLTSDVWNKMPNPSRLGVGCDDPTVFHNIRVIEMTGRGKKV